jgi:biopolymer transport protein ExbD
MAFAEPRFAGTRQPMAEINMIPLIDVMLVLLVIFIITAPLLTHAVRIELPKASSRPPPDRVERVQLAIEASGAVHWNGEALTRAAWQARMAEAARRQPAPELHIHADGAVAYRSVATVMADAAAAGLGRIGFVAEPEKNNR